MSQKRITPTPEMWNVLTTQKGGHFYAFLYTDSGGQKHLMRAMGKLAANPDLNFTWRDAAIMGKKARLVANTEGGI